MIRKIDEKCPDWQSRRTPADGWSPAGAIDAPGSVARALARESRQGWDPWEVWLRRIDQPRRRGVERE